MTSLAALCLSLSSFRFSQSCKEPRELIHVSEQSLCGYEEDHQKHCRLGGDAVYSEHLRLEEYAVAHAENHYRNQSYVELVRRFCDFSKDHKSDEGHKHRRRRGYALFVDGEDLAEHYQRADADEGGKAGRRSHFEHVAQEASLYQIGVRLQ